MVCVSFKITVGYYALKIVIQDIQDIQDIHDYFNFSIISLFDYHPIIRYTSIELIIWLNKVNRKHKKWIDHGIIWTNY